MKEPRRNWTEAEIEKAIDLYVRTPFGRLHSENPEVIDLAGRIGRTPGAVAIKLTNIASLDETLDRKGMSHASKLDGLVWNRFFEGLRQASKNFEPNPMQSSASDKPQATYIPPSNAGTVIQRLTNTRKGQSYFREMVLASYDNRCAITGISQQEFLVAGHIRPWSVDADNRMNPHNGICLNRLHDKAFEEKLIAIENDGKILYSSRLKQETKEKMLRLNDSGRFRLPVKFQPTLEFLEEHRDQFHFLERTS